MKKFIYKILKSVFAEEIRRATQEAVNDYYYNENVKRTDLIARRFLEELGYEMVWSALGTYGAEHSMPAPLLGDGKGHYILVNHNKRK